MRVYAGVVFVCFASLFASLFACLCFECVHACTCLPGIPLCVRLSLRAWPFERTVGRRAAPFRNVLSTKAEQSILRAHAAIYDVLCLTVVKERTARSGGA